MTISTPDGPTTPGGFTSERSTSPIRSTPAPTPWLAILADGWYSGYVGFGKLRDHYGKQPRFRALLHLELADGSTADVATGPAWRATTGPIHEADFLMGEVYDARQARAWSGWTLRDSMTADGAPSTPAPR